MDVLSEVLNTVSFVEAEYSVVALAEYAAGGPPLRRPGNAIDVLAVRTGSLDVLASDAVLRLERGDLVVLARAASYELANAPRSGICQFISIRLLADRPFFQPLLAALPDLLPLRHQAHDGGRVAGLLELAAEESGGHRDGRETILARTGELIFADIVRCYFEETAAGRSDWLSGLRDPHLGEALQLLHQRPIEPWTVDRLAREVGLSRSVFAERFHRHFGIGAMHYLAHWRIETAAKRLRHSSISLAEAGAEIGYRSDAAFCRAFKRHIGVSPGLWRSGRPPFLPILPAAADDHGFAS